MTRLGRTPAQQSTTSIIGNLDLNLSYQGEQGDQGDQGAQSASNGRLGVEFDHGQGVARPSLYQMKDMKDAMA
jgi:hypothetical protein